MQHGSTRYRLIPRLIIAGRFITLLTLVCYTLTPDQMTRAAVVQPDLLTATSFSVIGATTVTNTGPTVIGPTVITPAGNLGGDVGLSPGTSVIGFPPGIVVPPGTMYIADAVALQAQADVTNAFSTLGSESPCTALPGSVGTLTLTPGIYCFTTTALFTMPSLGLTLDLQGDPNALFVFQIPSALTTQPNYPVNFINGSAPCNVWWQVGSSATLDTNTQFVGNILALVSVTMNTGSTLLPGRAFAQTGAVTLDTNTINNAGCLTLASTSTPTNTPVPTNTSTSTATNTPVPPPTNTPIPPTTAPTAVSLDGTASAASAGSTTSAFPSRLPGTGYPPLNVPDNGRQLAPIVVVGGVLLLAGLWSYKRRHKVR